MNWTYITCKIFTIHKRLQARAFREDFTSQLKNNFRTRKTNYTENVLRILPPD